MERERESEREQRGGKVCIIRNIPDYMVSATQLAVLVRECRIVERLYRADRQPSDGF